MQADSPPHPLTHSPPPLVDTHCHLNHEQLRDDVDAVIARAVDAGVTRMVVVGYDLASSEEAVQLADGYEGVYAAVAVHPHDARHYDDSAGDRLCDLARNPRVVAIGEIGLDYHYDFSPRDAQYRAFQAQLALARECGLPVIIHCREAYPDTLDVLESEMDRALSGVMHCWAGSQAEAERALGLGMYLGFGGVITFKNAEETREVARTAPMDRLLVETDAPYLAPVPYRGKRNEPAYTLLAAEKLAEIRAVDLAAIASASTRNAETLFARIGIPGC